MFCFYFYFETISACCIRGVDSGFTVTNMAASEEVTYFVVNNIPSRLRSADLRNYFSQFIESKGFLCFHYRHRPEVSVPFTAADAGASERAEGSDGPGGKQAGLCCCVVSVRSRESDRFVKMYSGNQWIDSKGNWLRRKCLIRRVRVSEQAGEWPFKIKVPRYTLRCFGLWFFCLCFHWPTHAHTHYKCTFLIN